jgi:hypothetical protein
MIPILSAPPFASTKVFLITMHSDNLA